MSPDERLNTLLTDAVEAAKTAAAESAKARETVGKALVERQDFYRWMRRVLLLLVVVLVLLLPLAVINARNLGRTADTQADAAVTLEKVERTLDIVEDVTGPGGQAKAARTTQAAICALINDNRAVHGEPPLAACEQAEAP